MAHQPLYLPLDGIGKLDFSRFYAGWVDPIKETGWRCGYNMLVHGSLKRDLDVLAVPWIEDATSDAVLAEEIRKLFNGRIAPAPYNPKMKPHGRITWSIHFGPIEGDFTYVHAYVDLGVMTLHHKE